MSDRPPALTLADELSRLSRTLTAVPWVRDSNTRIVLRAEIADRLREIADIVEHSEV